MSPCTRKATKMQVMSRSEAAASWDWGLGTQRGSGTFGFWGILVDVNLLIIGVCQKKETCVRTKY